MLNTIADLLPSTYTHNILCMYSVHSVQWMRSQALEEKKRDKERKKNDRNAHINTVHQPAANTTHTWRAGVDVCSHYYFLAHSSPCVQKLHTNTAQTCNKRSPSWVSKSTSTRTYQKKTTTIPNKKNCERTNETELKHAHTKIVRVLSACMRVKRSQRMSQPTIQENGKKMNGEKWERTNKRNEKWNENETGLILSLGEGQRWRRTTTNIHKKTVAGNKYIL